MKKEKILIGLVAVLFVMSSALAWAIGITDDFGIIRSKMAEIGFRTAEIRPLGAGVYEVKVTGFTPKTGAVQQKADIAVTDIFIRQGVDCDLKVKFKNTGQTVIDKPLRLKLWVDGKLLRDHSYLMKLRPGEEHIYTPEIEVSLNTVRVSIDTDNVLKEKNEMNNTLQKRLLCTSTGTGKREATGVDFTAISPTGTGYREATGVDFTAISPTGTGYREAIGVDFTAISPTGTGYREATGVDFTAISPTGTGYREATGVDFTAISPTGTGYREATGADFTAVPL